MRQITLAVALGAAAVLGTAAPAGAHTVGGVNATNYRTRVLSVRPAVRGVDLRAVDNGNRLELTNTTAHDVIVQGYDGEPYLRVGPRGVFENTRSPATYLNRALLATTAVPASADPTAPPEWHRVDGGTTVRWHDHRAHWMGLSQPPAVQRAPGRPQLVQRFTVDLATAGRTLHARGDVWWIPGPSPWPWIALAVVFGLAVVVGARTRAAARVVGIALALTLVCVVVHAAGAWSASVTSTLRRFGDATPTLGAVALGVIALVHLARRGLRAAAPLLVFAGLFVGIAIGLADLTALYRSQLPTELLPALDRLTIALALGGGFGVALGAAFHVRPVDPSRPPRRRPRHAPVDGPSDARDAFAARNAVGH